MSAPSSETALPGPDRYHEGMCRRPAICEVVAADRRAWGSRDRRCHARPRLRAVFVGHLLAVDGEDDLGDPRGPVDLDLIKSQDEKDERDKNVISSSPGNGTGGGGGGAYKCHICGLSASRLNVIVLHQKTCKYVS